MNRVNPLLLGVAVLAAAVGAGLAVDRPVVGASVAPSSASVWRAATPTVRVGAQRGVLARPTVEPIDSALAYAAMRDDINPKPRLQLIDRWARRAPSDSGSASDAASDAILALLGEAMVDPDPAVRERAEVLFEREMQRHRASETGPIVDKSTSLELLPKEHR